MIILYLIIIFNVKDSVNNINHCFSYNEISSILIEQLSCMYNLMYALNFLSIHNFTKSVIYHKLMKNVTFNYCKLIGITKLKLIQNNNYLFNRNWRLYSFW